MVRVVLLGAILFAVFCAAAGATLWLKGTRKAPPLPATVDSSGTAEHFSQQERDALADLLKNQKSPKTP